MEKLTLADAVRVSGCQYFGPEAALAQPLTGIVTDSRSVKPGRLFAAMRGARVDGHDYIAAALAQGALAALCERLPANCAGPRLLVESSEQALGAIARYYRSLFPADVIGVSGSVGKTSCKDMIASVLSQKYCLLKTEGNFNNALGLPLTLFRLESAHRLAVVEMGISDFGEMRYLAGIAQPSAAVLTNIGDAHLEQLHDRNGVLAAKTEMLEALPDGAPVYLNADDALLAAYRPAPRLRPIYFGTGAGCDFRATMLRETADGLDCRIDGVALHINAYGSYNVYSALAAFALGRAYGLGDAALAAGVAAFAPARGRGNIIRTARLRIVDHSYNANPNSMAAALASLCMLTGRKAAVLGDMNELGADSAAMHRAVGEQAARAGFAPLVCIGVKARAIFDSAQQAGCRDAHWFPDVDAALAALPSLLLDGDTILVKASNAMKLNRVVEALQTL